ncbi:tumor suppressor, Mitostatin, putative [Trypanosoma equiperdum]|uniref:Meiosis-specific nuclear structural protein 1 n=4 Tax=Trypanozoon TaxID=39700 RepID=Q587B8_TRYB2|nr:hypothetical protein, conserved [Trypanosoma brucei gambiense DAL972]XP_845569.1 hypothetical protein, conserved [Trypanosoma brucei brucei TREU927]AAX79259.1 hypothetical protein, conserved [Trypanosoma brucei]RHW71801.1 tumor suppressor [Trypanosoma brucei equiperdum]SCU64263.1 Tumour suppressor, Mitostatin, putative [Trypanosoma equiperdum]AAZ12010.1 hypothetical protein, conserved [Trypanosoma brucei brucei TREU927]CBH11952.1 hypothetical protein, conserved [Trypanosoma brucei gambiens|eukprot:XP_011774237.1 hypothetical protein, conserved [Trypanosoma brucei gambiense DAL972]
MDAGDARVERLRRVNRYKAVQAELAREREEAEFQAMRERKISAAARDEALAKELAERQRLELKDAKMLQFVRDLPELRNLEAQLKHARMKVDRSDQVDECCKRREERLQEEREYNAYLAEKEAKEKAEEEEKRRKAIQAFNEHQAAQLKLIEERRAQAERDAEQSRQERFAVDAVAARLQEKEFLEALERREKQRQLQAEQDEFYRLRKEIKENERLRQQREDEAIEAYLAEKGRRRETDEKLLREKEAVKARILEEQSKKIMEERLKREELESLLSDYYEAERISRERQALADAKERSEKLADAVKQENWNLIQDRIKARDLERQEEAMMRQKAVEDLAQQAKAKRLERERQIEIKKQKILETERRLEKFQELKREEQRLAAEVEERERKRAEELQEYIRRARAQLLEEYVPTLGQHVPARLLTVDEKKKFGITK